MSRARLLLPLPFALLIWHVVSSIAPSPLIPGPMSVASALMEMTVTGELTSDVLSTLRRVCVGCALGSASAVLVGVLTGRIRLLGETLGQVINVARPIPVIAIVPLALVWFGIGEVSKYFLVFWGVFFPVWLNTHLGVSRVDRRLIWAARSLGSSSNHVLTSVVLPAAVPMILSGMRTGLAIGFVCVVAAEMSGAFGGVGYRIYASHMVFRVDKMLAGLFVLGTMGALMDVCFAWLAAQLFPWMSIEART